MAALTVSRTLRAGYTNPKWFSIPLNLEVQSGRVSTSNILCRLISTTSNLRQPQFVQMCFVDLGIRDSNIMSHIDRLRRFYVTANKTQECWNCGRDIDSINEQFFCDCGMIQPPQTRNYFEVFGVVESFHQDVKVLQRRFRDLQWRLHPDKFSTKTKTEQEHALEQSILVNRAYKTLTTPILRGLYMLKLHGLALEEGEIQMNASFLINIMEVNEDIDDAKSPDILLKIQRDNNSIIDSLNSDISVAFSKNDFVVAKEAIIRLKYYTNIAEKVDKALESFTSM